MMNNSECGMRNSELQQTERVQKSVGDGVLDVPNTRAKGTTKEVI